MARNLEDNGGKQIHTSKISYFGFCIILKSLSFITLYLFLSISIVFYQRWMLKDIHFPLTVVLCHLTMKFIFASMCRSIWECCSSKERVDLPWSPYMKSIGLAGIAGGLDIGLSNWGLHLITVSLYTMTKSTAIIFILFFTLVFRLEKKSWTLIFVVFAISIGLFLTTYKATEFNVQGFLLILTASFASGLRWTLSQFVMQKSAPGMSNPLDMLYHMQPWMMWPLLPLAIIFEGTYLATSCLVFRYEDFHILWSTMGKVLLGSVAAFSMEISEFLVVSHTSSLTLSVSGVCKDILTLILAVEWAGDPMNAMKFVGLMLCLGGISYHSYKKTQDIQRGINETGKLNLCDSSNHAEVNIPLLTELNNSELSRESSVNTDVSDEEVLFNMLHRGEVR